MANAGFTLFHYFRRFRAVLRLRFGAFLLAKSAAMANPMRKLFLQKEGIFAMIISPLCNHHKHRATRDMHG